MTMATTYASLTLRTDSLIITAENEPALNELTSMAIQDQGRVGVIGEEFPFISNLDIGENITLGTMYRQNITLEHALEDLTPSIRALGMEEVIKRRKELLTVEEMIYSQILRALSGGNNVVFMLSPTTALTDTVVRAVAAVPPRLKIWIACHVKAASAYEYLGFSTLSITG